MAPTSVQAAPVVQTPDYAALYGSDKVSLMQQAGIAPSDYGAADYIISHESSWNADATEPTSGAHGLPQALPYSKTGCGWVDAVCQLKWANSYAAEYGGWWPAYNFWNCTGQCYSTRLHTTIYKSATSW